MAENTKTPQEVRQILTKAIREKIEEFKRATQEPQTYTPDQALFIVKEAVKEQIEGFKKSLENLQSLEKGEKGVQGGQPMDTPNAKAWSNFNKRKKHKHKLSDTQDPAKKSEHMQKDLFGLPGPADTTGQMAHKLTKNVFNVMKKTNGVIDTTFKAEELDKNAPGDPSWSGDWNVHHVAPHGTYRMSGSLQSNQDKQSKPVELHYASGTGNNFKHLGTFKGKDAATDARIEHHDRISAGFKKAEPTASGGKGKHPSYAGTDVDNNKHRREETENLDLRAKDSTLPMDKMPENAETPGSSGSGGEWKPDVKKAGEIQPYKPLVPHASLGIKPHVPALQTNMADQAHATQAKTLSAPVKTAPAKPSAMANQTKSLRAPSPILKAGPRLGGKDPMSQAMTQDATRAYKPLSVNTMQQKNKQMPAGQQSGKMPSPAEHAQRQEGYGEHMPQGAFKSETIGQMMNSENGKKT